jgi:hypothetical protein
MSMRHPQTGVDGDGSRAAHAQPRERETVRRLTRRSALAGSHATQGIGGRVCAFAMPSLVIVLALVGVGCGTSSHSGSSAAKSTSTAIESPTATVTTQAGASPSRTASSSKAAGYGASEAAWNSSHTPDNSYPSGSAYDSDPSLPEVEGHASARYTEVAREGGRIVAYKYHFPATAIAAAKANVLRTQFPSDAHQVWFTVMPACAFMLVRSDSIARQLRGAGAGGSHAGEPKIEFTSASEEEERSTGSSYDASGVTVAYLAPAISASPAQAEC